MWLLALISVVFVLSAAAAVAFQLQIKRAEQQFPAAVNIPLAADKSYGVTVPLTLYSEEELHRQLDAMQEARLIWLRVPFNWSEIEAQPGQFNWQAYDRVAGAAHLRGFKVIAALQTSPGWSRAEGTSPHTPPTEAADFGSFARAAAQRYQKEIDHFQIWREPNLSEYWGDKYVDPAAYTLLLKNAAINIRAVNSQAKILSASLAPTTQNGPLNLNESDYLQGMYQAKAAPYFDILGAELFGFHLPIEPIQSDPQLLNIHRVTLLRQVMQANGDGAKPIWATAFGWNALPTNWQGRPPLWPSDAPEKQLARTEEALSYARANWPWLGPILAPRWDGVGLHPDDPERGFAIYPELLPAFEYAAKNTQRAATVGSYPATHPTGDYSYGWNYGRNLVDIPRQTEDNSELPDLNIPFEGTRLDLNITRGNYQGYLWVTVDEQPANALPLDERGQSYVVLQDPLREDALVTLARNLPDGPHQAVIQAEGGWGQWAISGWRVYREANTQAQSGKLALSLLVAVLSGAAMLALARPAFSFQLSAFSGRWSAVGGLWSAVGGLWSAVILTLALMALPWPLHLLTLPLLGMVFLLNPQAGLMALSFSISFFIFPKSLLVKDVGVVELLLALLLAATLLRLLVQTFIQRAERLGFGAESHPLPNPPPEKGREYSFSRADGAALALIALAALTTFTARHVGAALYELRTVILGPAIFYFLIRYLSPRNKLSKAVFAQQLIDAFVAGATLHAASALWQYAFDPAQTITAEGVRRAIGYLYGSPNNLSLFLERVFPILAAIALFGARGIRRVLYALALLVVGAALFLTYSKGSLLLAIPASLVFLALMRGGKLAWMAVGSGLTVLAMALLPLIRTERFRQTFSLQPGSTAFTRVKLWQSAWQMLKEHPLTGLGPDNFLYQYRTRYILPEAWAEPDLSHPHNLLLNFGTRLGIGGIFALLWLQGEFWISAFKKYFRSTDEQTKVLLLGLMGSMITFLLHGLVDNAFFLVDLAYTFFLIFGITELLAQDGHK